MAISHPAAKGDSAATAPIETGGFPFPLTGGPEESPYLTWLRNHSNYMTARGLFDYLRAAGVLARGMIVNFLIFLPYLLLVAIVLANAHHWMLAHPFRLTLGVLGLALAWILIFPVLVPLFKIVGYRRSLDTGSDSSVRQRDRYERSFGGLLLAIMVAAALESLPWALEFVHDQIQLGRLTWQGGMASGSAALALLGGANRLLSVLGGAKRKVAMVVVGLMGLLVPLIVILSATDYLLYGLPPSLLWMFSPLVVPVVGVIGIAMAVPLGLWRNAFTGREIVVVLALLLAGLTVVAGAISLGRRAVLEAVDSIEALHDPLQKIELLAAPFEEISNEATLDPEVAALVRGIVAASRESQRASLAFEARVAELEGTWPDSASSWFRRFWYANYYAQALNERSASQLQLVSLADKLSGRSDEDLAPLRLELTRLAHGQVLESIRRALSDPEVAALLRSALVEHYLVVSLDRAVEGDSGRKGDPIGLVRRRFKQLAADSAHTRAIARARADLEESAVTDIAMLLGEAQLARAVAAKFAEVPGKAASARLAGKDTLVNLLTREELLDLVFPKEERGGRAWLARSLRAWLLDQAVPQFPVDTPDYDRRTFEAAVALARLAEPRPVAEQDSTVSLGLAFYYSTDALRESGANEPPLTTFGEAPTEVEIARAAGRRLARRVLDDFDVDHLMALAFRETMEAAEGSSLEQELTRERGSAATDTVKLREFLELEKRPLELLASAAFASPPGGLVDTNATAVHASHQDIREQLPYLMSAAYRDKVLLAAEALGDDTDALARLARLVLIERALDSPRTLAEERAAVSEGFAEFDPSLLGSDEHARLAALRLRARDSEYAHDLVAKLIFGVHGRLEQDRLKAVKQQFTDAVKVPKVIFVSLVAVVIWLLWWLTVDVNLTSIHGLYRDRLASAFLVGKDTKGDIGIEDDIDLDDICRYEARSTAPYHLINVALNLQGSRDIGIRGRQSDFFIFSKRFTGGQRTGYCRSETLEQVFPQMDVATAMAISAAAAAPNMGRATSPFLVAFMTLLNIRLGYWVPNPGLLEERRDTALWKLRKRDPRRATQPPGFTFAEVFAEELREIESRRDQVYPDGARGPGVSLTAGSTPTVERGLVGIGFSGGGIRSASINLGITQALHQYGVFDHLDYMSTVSGGGYLGSSISTLMRARERLVSEIAGTVTVDSAGGRTVTVTPNEVGEPPRTYRYSGRAELNVRNGERIGAGTPLLQTRAARGRSDIAGRVTVEDTGTGERVVRIEGDGSDGQREYRFSRFDSILVKSGDTVAAGDRLIRRYDTLGGRFSWRVRPVAFLREMRGKLDETHRWVNLSDGGHIENLAAIELLRRRCKYVIIGDGEADPELHFAGLATLMRYAFIDFGIHIEIDLDPIRLRASGEGSDGGAVSGAHWAVGTITYPATDANGQPETGCLLYLKSSFTGDEDEIIREYRHRNPTFPHESTADQAFDEDQFEAYRALGQHIAGGALRVSRHAPAAGRMSFDDFEDWFARLREEHEGEGEG